MRLLIMSVATVGNLVSVLLTAMSTLLLVVGMIVQVNIWYFPGDPPVLDLALVLGHDEFVALRAKHVPKPVPLRMPGWGTVHLRMAHGVYPYVGIDFGGGAHAFFDPLTMYCTYSD